MCRRQSCGGENMLLGRAKSPAGPHDFHREDGGLYSFNQNSAIAAVQEKPPPPQPAPVSALKYSK